MMSLRSPPWDHTSQGNVTLLARGSKVLPHQNYTAAGPRERTLHIKPLALYLRMQRAALASQRSRRPANRIEQMHQSGIPP